MNVWGVSSGCGSGGSGVPTGSGMRGAAPCSRSYLTTPTPPPPPPPPPLREVVMVRGMTAAFRSEVLPAVSVATILQELAA